MNYRLFKIGHISVYSYGVMIAIAFIFGIALAVRYAKKLNENPQNVMDLCLYIMISSIIGARLCYVITNWRYYLNNPIEVFYVQEGGLVFYGGLILAVIVAFVFLKSKKLNILRYFDILAPSLVLGQAFGRIGCFLNGCCYGRVVYNKHLAFLGVKFPRVVDITNDSKGNFMERLIGSPAYIDQLSNGLITAKDTASLPVYPAQLFSTFLDLIIFCFLVYLFKKRAFDGQIWCFYLFLYSTARFFIEFIRGDNPLLPPLNLTFSQIISIILFVIGLVIYFFSKKKNNYAR